MHWLDIILLLLLGISLIRGFSSGFIKQAIKLLSLLGASLLASHFSLFMLDLIASQGLTIKSSWIAWIISFLVLTIIFYLLGMFLLSGMKLILGILDRIMGALFSFLTTCIIISLLIGFYTNIGQEYGWNQIPEGLKIYPIVVEVSKTILPNDLLIEKKDNCDSFEVKEI